ncbi:MAG: PAS domain S-box protein [Methanotrichaceae archaeon]|nr:PAS domain S-box protein [Methanotrichaceae archaeon]
MLVPFRILIVEDDPEHADLIRLGFKKHDEFFLDFVSTGEQGLEMTAHNSYDLISIDLILPGISGLDVLVNIRKLDPDIPVVMVSGRGTADLVVVAFENRATKYVVKSLESFRSMPYIFENLIQEARFKISERKMKEQIERSERVHRSVVENALAGIYILQEGLFKLVNPKLAEIFGYDPDTLIGNHFWQLVKPDDIECISKLGGNQHTPAPVYESKILRKDGETRWIEFRTVPIEYEGHRAILGNLVDITLRKEREISLLETNRELTVINKILNRTINTESDIEKMLEDTLEDIVCGIDGAKIGGIFLNEKEGLVLKALNGSVEELISFIEGVDLSSLMNATGFIKCDHRSAYQWMSAPIIFDGIKEGAIIVASEPVDKNRALAFLENVIRHLGCLIESYRQHTSMQHAVEP